MSRFRRAQQNDESSRPAGDPIAILDPANVASEAYRTLRTNLLYSRVDTPQKKVIVLTSAGPHEGKSTTCANLAVVLAQAGKDTLLVDCDLRKPIIHRMFGLSNVWGMVSILMGERDLQQTCTEVLSGLKVVTTGPIPPDPSELLGSQRFAEFLADVRERFDYVLIDSPPVRAVSDPVILAAQADGVLLVLDAQATRKASFGQAKRSLEAVGATVLGTVMNNVKAGERGPYLAYGNYVDGR